MNEALGDVGTTVRLHADASRRSPSDQLADLAALVADMDAGTRRPAGRSCGVEPGLRRAARPEVRGAHATRCALRVYHRAATRTRPRRCASGTCRRRTSSSSGATRAPSTARCRSCQPLIAPLYESRSAHELRRGAQRARSTRRRYDARARLLEARSSTRRSTAFGPLAKARRQRVRRVRGLLAPGRARRLRGGQRVRAACTVSRARRARSPPPSAPRRPMPSSSRSGPAPNRVRRALRQQRLAAGTAAARSRRSPGTTSSLISPATAQAPGRAQRRTSSRCA